MLRSILTGIFLMFATYSFSCAQDNGDDQAVPVGSDYNSTPIGSDYNSTPIGSDYNSTLKPKDEFCNNDDCEDECGCQDCYGCSGTRDCDALSRCKYVSFFGGWTGLDSFTRIDIGMDETGVNRGVFDDGEIFGIALGSQVHPNVRYELEGTYRSNDSDQWAIDDYNNGIRTTTASSVASGELESYTAMVNFLFDMPRRQPGCWNAYAGVGFGAAFLDGNISAGGNVYDVNDSSFAFQAMGGVTRAMSKKVDLFTEYRYLTSRHISVNNISTVTPLGDFEYNAHSILFGIRWRR